jgi:hypothetical protein|tara:strand:- start:950 stop:1132 length:183 start_codon:yes stop_codon:yes gene_type:complete
MSDWISVDDMFKPEEGQSVLVCYGKGSMRVAQSYGTLFYMGSSYHMTEVTHWMPLPEPPK